MKKLALALMVLVLLPACQFATRMGNRVTGSGNRTSEQRNVAQFSSIEIDGAYQLSVQCGKAQSVEIEADDNILPLIKTDSSSGKLVISSKENFSTNSSPVVKITVPELKEVSSSGASEIDVKDVKSDDFSIDIKGASKIKATGDAQNTKISLNGAGDADLQNLRAQSVKVTSNGAGHVSVYAVDTLDVTVNGVGSVDYYGNPKNIQQHVNGLGSVNKK